MSPLPTASSDSSPIDELMDRASDALVRTAYFQAEDLAQSALRRAFQARDYERMARICLPLLEARRQKIQLAQDAGRVVIVDETLAKTGPTAAGLYLIQPPMLAFNTREFRQLADRRQVPIFILAREPMTRAGKWPLAAVAPGLEGRDITLRTYVDPPPGVIPTTNGMTRDTMSSPPTAEWMLSAGEILGDAALARLNPQDPAAHRIEDLLEYLDAWPLHEKLHQRLMDECKLAITQPAPANERRRGIAENPWSF
ncbi:MAG: hypothetical protein IT435_17230 [Phycisphaerales bacterium]|nr:hypothetical protein [Phycisphaerales bacterium]